MSDNLEIIKTHEDLTNFFTGKNFFFLCFFSKEKHTEKVFRIFSKFEKLSKIAKIAFLEAEKFEILAESYNIDMMPSLVLFKIHPSNKRPVSFDTSNPNDSKNDPEKYFSQCFEKLLQEKNGEIIIERKDEISTELRNDVNAFLNSKPVMCLIEDWKEERISEILKENQIVFDRFNVDSELDVKRAIQEVSKRKDFPQLYINGKFIGGKKEVETAHKNGSLLKKIPLKSKKENFQKQLKLLTNSSRVVVFMKGDFMQPKCGFSRKMATLLETHSGNGFQKIEAFDILEDDKVRQELKDFSGWKTYPQLYVDGELVGGLDVALQLAEEGELEDIFKGCKNIDTSAINKLTEIEKYNIGELINKNVIFAFIKGDSNELKKTLNNVLKEKLETESFGCFDVKANIKMCKAIKIHSGLNEFPIFYVGGEFVGGIESLEKFKWD